MTKSAATHDTHTGAQAQAAHKRQQNNSTADFVRFMKERERAANAYVQGDVSPLSRITTRVQHATFFGPQGGCTEGAEEVSSRYARDAEGFQPGGNSGFEILEMAADDNLAYWTGFQNALARMEGKTEVVPMKLRVTEVFHREGDDWKLVHRHADPLASEEVERSK